MWSASGRTAHVACNDRGRDFVVGDVHGHFTALRALLDSVGFDPDADRLLSVGDLIDRGPESPAAIEWLESGRIAIATLGNHEEMMLRALRGAADAEASAVYLQMDEGERYMNWFRNGGNWWIQTGAVHDDAALRRWRLALERKPYGVTVDTPHGPVGIVHASPLWQDWDAFLAAMEEGTPEARTRALWTRLRARGFRQSSIDPPEGHADAEIWYGPYSGVRCVMAGHSPVKEIAWDHNLLNLDSGVAYRDLLTIARIDCAPVALHQVEHVHVPGAADGRREWQAVEPRVLVAPTSPAAAPTP